MVLVVSIVVNDDKNWENFFGDYSLFFDFKGFWVGFSGLFFRNS